VIKDLYRYVWKISSRDQVILSVLSVTLFLLELAPLELQRRIVNSAVDRRAFEVIGLLCLLYVVAVLVQGGRFFPTAAEARLVGSTFGGSVLKMHCIRVGMCMEIDPGTDDGPVTGVVLPDCISPATASIAACIDVVDPIAPGT